MEGFASKPYIIQIYMKSKQSYNFLSLKEQTKGQIDWKFDVSAHFCHYLTKNWAFQHIHQGND